MTQKIRVGIIGVGKYGNGRVKVRNGKYTVTLEPLQPMVLGEE